jgi:hypothetical protein
MLLGAGSGRRAPTISLSSIPVLRGGPPLGRFDSVALRDKDGACFTSSRQAPQAALAKDAKGGRRGLRGVRLARQGSMRSTSPVPTEMLPMET